jgi:hypothetical protein
MAFPANYNIQYYQGDTYQFVIRPKTSAGEIFPVTSTVYDAYFRIDTQRGRTDGLGIEASASILDNSVTCTITPAVGNSLVAGTTYFYDVSIEDKTDPNIIYTLLTGTITITADIAGS